MVALGVAQLLLEDPDPFYERGIEIAAQIDNMDISDVTEFVKEEDESNKLMLSRALYIPNAKHVSKSILVKGGGRVKIDYFGGGRPGARGVPGGSPRGPRRVPKGDRATKESVE